MAKTRGVPYARGLERGRRKRAVASYLIQLLPVEAARVQDAAIRSGLSVTRWIHRVVIRELARDPLGTPPEQNPADESLSKRK